MKTGVSFCDISTAVYLTNGTEELVWLDSDRVALSNADAKVTRRRIAQETGIPYENVIFSAHFQNADSQPKNSEDPYWKTLMQATETWVANAVEAKKNAVDGIANSTVLPAFLAEILKSASGCDKPAIKTASAFVLPANMETPVEIQAVRVGDTVFSQSSVSPEVSPLIADELSKLIQRV